MATATYHVGDVFDVMATLPDASVDLVLTSPPFLALRSYLPDDHPDKVREIGSEPTPAEFLDTLLALTAEWDRLLAPHGSICVELGDTYAGTGGGVRPVKASPDTQSHRAMGDGQVIITGGDGWPLDKSLCGIPTLYAWSLAYGRNLLTGKESPAGRWRIRNVVAWCRPNPPVGALGDKFRPATSYITIATKARDRWFDLDAVRTTTDASGMRRVGDASSSKGIGGGDSGNPDKLRTNTNPAGAPPLDWWEVTTEPYSGSHYATWPRKLLTRPIESMCPKEVCRTCGEPRRRITDKSPEYAEVMKKHEGRDHKAAGTDLRMGNLNGDRPEASFITLGWTDCGHDDYRRGIVLDPFAGSGTTLAVATGLGRDAVGIDLDSRNADLAAERVGMFLEVA